MGDGWAIRYGTGVDLPTGKTSFAQSVAGEDAAMFGR